MASPKRHDISFGASPGRAQSADAGVGLGARCEFGFEFARERPVGGDSQLRAGRGERLVRRWRRAIDGEARARQRLERRSETRRACPVVHPGEPGKQRQRLAVEVL
jgi:hypothetical protein